MKPRGAALIFPERKRCRACRNYFGFLVVDGMYDSYACAGRPDPEDAPPESWPREHRTTRVRWNGERIIVAKRDFQTWKSAKRWAKVHGKQAYRCGFCNGLHIGSLRPEVQS